MFTYGDVFNGSICILLGVGIVAAYKCVCAVLALIIGIFIADAAQSREIADRCT